MAGGNLDTIDDQNVQNDPGQSYGAYEHASDFQHDLGIIVLPIASRTPAHRQIRLHGGYAKRIVKWRAERAGRPPIIPAATDTAGDSLLRSSVTANLPRVSPQSGFYTFEMEGQYEYVQTVPRVAGVNTLPTAAFPYPVEPMDTLAAAQVGASLDQFNDQSSLDEIALAAEAAVIENGGPQFRWPFTFVSPYFTAETITG